MTLKPSRLRYVVLMLVSIVFVAVGALEISDGSSVMGWITIGFFGAGVVVFAVTLIPGSAYLRLQPTGFTVCTFFKPRFISWCEVDSFEVGRIGRRKGVSFNFTELRKGHKALRGTSRIVTGYEGRIPDTYRLSAEELADLMNE
jgi:hypothetical protein